MLQYKIYANPQLIKLAQLCQRGVPVHYYPTSTEEARELILEPEFYYSVWNCSISLVASFFKNNLSSIQIAYPEPPLYVVDAALDDIYRQGRALNISGLYQITSSKVWRFIKSKKFQRWLEEEAKKHGIEIVKTEKAKKEVQNA
jgi:hypothetical protein